ncbi:MAG: PKD domain-containing protein [Bernardetiaceae bacterium]|nr:PKD domain-containing protein [Bernardetiaceae bacterium]
MQPILRYIYLFLTVLGVGASSQPTPFALPQPVSGLSLVPNKAVVKLTPVSSLAELKRLPQVKEARWLLPEPKGGWGQLVEVHLQPGQEIGLALAQLAKQPGVLYAEPVPYALAASLPNDPLIATDRDASWGHFQVKAPEAWELSKGDSSIVIAVVDGGVHFNHPDLRDRVWRNWPEHYGRSGVDDDGNGYVDDVVGVDLADPNNPGMTPTTSHGTWVTGIMSSTPNNNLGLAGVGYNCRFMPIKVYDARGRLEATAIYQAIKYAADNGARIVNLSLYDLNDRPLRFAQEIINYAVLQKNVLVVAAAGNTNRSEYLFPASYDHVLSVAGLDRDDNRYNQAPTLGTTFNHLVDLAAPAVDLTSTGVNDGFLSGHTGTSFAAPFVSGAAGLVMARYPELNALQVGELLRVTSDNIYQRPANQLANEQLGRGRLNIQRALQERYTAKAVRLRSFRAENRFGAYVHGGDTLSIRAVFANYLQATTANARVRLSAVSPQARVLGEAEFRLGALVTRDSVSNQAAPFRVALAANTPANSPLVFKLDFIDQNYVDYQYFVVYTSPYFIDLQLNKFSLSAAANGRLGRVDAANREGLGVLYNGQLVAQEMGLLIGFNATAVSNAVRSLPGQKSTDFGARQPMRVVERGWQHLSARGVFTDSVATSRLNLAVEQQVYGRINTPHHQYFVVHNDIQNLGFVAWDSLRVGWLADWDLSPQDQANWDQVGQFGYTQNAAGNQFMAVKVLGGTQRSHRAIHKSQPSPDLNWADGLTVAEKFTALTGALNGPPAPSGDVAQVVATQIRALQPGEKRRVSFVVAGAATLAELRQAVAQAELFLNAATPRGPLPTVSPRLCASAPPFAIRPGNGTRFRFYRSDDLGNPQLIGAELPVTLADSARTIFISNVDSLIEGPLLPYRFRPHFTAVRFVTSTDSLNLVDSAFIHFADQSLAVVSRRWNFGDGSPEVTTARVRHRFTRTGNYRVSLTVTDTTGCTAVVSRTIKVVNLVRGPVPSIVSPLYACRTAPVQIAPVGGSRFNFYRQAPGPGVRPTFTGRSWTVADTAITQFWVTNLDSALESLPAAGAISRSRLRAAFDYSPRADTIVFDRITFVDRSTRNFNITHWEWNMGDGSRRNGQQVAYTYQRQGVYTVTLKVTDLLGCVDSTSQTFRVGRRGPLPNLPSAFQVCAGDSVTLRPSNGTRFNFYNSATNSRPFYTGRQYSFWPSQTSQIYVTNADSVVESASRAVMVTVIDLKPDFSFAETGQLYQIHFNAANFTNNPDISLVWNFDDGQPPLIGVSQPSHRFARPGNYRVSLTARHRLGCTATVTKTVTVRHLVPPPQVRDLVVCPGTEALISPEGGGTYLFYTQPPPAAWVGRGGAFNLGVLRGPTTVYVSQIDSLGESEVVPVRVSLADLSAEFRLQIPPAGLIVGDILRLEALDLTADAYQWELGNGQLALENRVSVRYNAPGVYKIKLTVQKNGCQVSYEMQVPVQSANAPTIIHNFRITPNPTSGNAVVSVNLGQFSPVTVRVVNLLGQVIYQEYDEWVLQKDYPISLGHLPRSVYIVQLIVGEEVLNTRLTLN